MQTIHPEIFRNLELSKTKYFAKTFKYLVGPSEVVLSQKFIANLEEIESRK